MPLFPSGFFKILLGFLAAGSDVGNNFRILEDSQGFFRMFIVLIDIIFAPVPIGILEDSFEILLSCCGDNFRILFFLFF